MRQEPNPRASTVALLAGAAFATYEGLIAAGKIEAPSLLKKLFPPKEAATATTGPPGWKKDARGHWKPPPGSSPGIVPDCSKGNRTWDAAKQGCVPKAAAGPGATAIVEGGGPVGWRKDAQGKYQPPANRPNEVPNCQTLRWDPTSRTCVKRLTPAVPPVTETPQQSCERQGNVWNPVQNHCEPKTQLRSINNGICTWNVLTKTLRRGDQTLGEAQDENAAIRICSGAQPPSGPGCDYVVEDRNDVVCDGLNAVQEVFERSPCTPTAPRWRFVLIEENASQCRCERPDLVAPVESWRSAPVRDDQGTCVVWVQFMNPCTQVETDVGSHYEAVEDSRCPAVVPACVPSWHETWRGEVGCNGFNAVQAVYYEDGCGQDRLDEELVEENSETHGCCAWVVATEGEPECNDDGRLVAYRQWVKNCTGETFVDWPDYGACATNGAVPEWCEFADEDNDVVHYCGHADGPSAGNWETWRISTNELLDSGTGWECRC